jgi:hypothetical protein
MKDPDVASYYGCHMRLTVAQGYMSGGAGYVLSRYNEGIVSRDEYLV